MLYIKALHIIFVITWFSGMFYIVRLFIYNTEANQKTGVEKQILQDQFTIMIRRLWFGITWPSAVLTLVFGPLMWYEYTGESMQGMLALLQQGWFLIKVCFVIGLYIYQLTLHSIYKQESKGVFKYTSGQLRVWNEVATIFLVAIVMVVVVKQGMGLVYGLLGLVGLVVLLMSAIKIYKTIRTSKQ